MHVKRVSRKQRAANRRNAKKSTGPRTPAGRQRVSRNAVKHGLAGGFALLPTEDPAAYEASCQEIIDEIAPLTQEQRDRARAIANDYWRLNRVPGIENTLFAEGNLFEQAGNLVLLSLYEQRLKRAIQNSRKSLKNQ